MIAFNHVVPVLNLSVFNVRRAPAFAFEQSKRATIGGRFIRVDESRDLPLLHVVEDFTQKPVCSFAVTTGGEIKIDSAAPAVDGPVQIRPAAIDLHVGFIHVPRAKIGRVTPVPAQPFFHFRRITLNPAVNRGVIDIHSAFSQHLLQLTVTDAVFAVPAYGPQNDVTLKMPAFEWVHVQLHQQKGMISLSPPTICNSALINGVIQAISLLLDYLESNKNLFNDPKILFQTFAKRLYSGTIGEDGIDPSGLYWIPSSTDNVNKHIHRLTAFTDWLANKHGAEPMNPLQIG